MVGDPVGDLVGALVGVEGHKRRPAYHDAPGRLVRVQN